MRRGCAAPVRCAQCLRTPDRTPTRQVACFRGRTAERAERHPARMQARIDTPEGRARYGRRFAIVEHTPTVGPLWQVPRLVMRRTGGDQL